VIWKCKSGRKWTWKTGLCQHGGGIVSSESSRVANKAVPRKQVASCVGASLWHGSEEWRRNHLCVPLDLSICTDKYKQLLESRQQTERSHQYRHQHASCWQDIMHSFGLVHCDYQEAYHTLEWTNHHPRGETKVYFTTGPSGDGRALLRLTKREIWLQTVLYVRKCLASVYHWHHSNKFIFDAARWFLYILARNYGQRCYEQSTIAMQVPMNRPGRPYSCSNEICLICQQQP